MIVSFSDRATEALFRGNVCDRRWRAFEAVARRKLDMLDAAITVMDLRVPPSNRLERLRGDREGQWSIRINNQWRICFYWEGDGPDRVEIVDYH